MKKLSHSVRLLIMSAMFLAITMGVSGAVNAAWYCTHGHSAHVTMGNLPLSSWSYQDWGLFGQFQSGKYSYCRVHFAVPSVGKAGSTKSIKLHYYTGYGAKVKKIVISNGKYLSRTINAPSAWQTKGYHDIKVDLGTPISSTYGIGITVYLESFASPDCTPDDYKFQFHSAQAEIL